MSFLSPINDALTLFASIRELCHSVSDRIDKFSGNAREFQKLKDELEIAEAKFGVCQTTLENYCAAITTQSLQFELIELQRLEKAVQRVQQSVEELSQKQQQKRGPLKRFLRAKTSAQDTSQQVQTVQEVIAQIDKLNETLMGIAQQSDIFHADFSTVPSLRVPVHLDFDKGDTMEGKLKKKVLERVDHSAHNNHTGYAHVTAAVGVTGMGGIGKTTALIGLANDTEVREKFSDGIYFVPVGKDATVDKLIRSLQGIVEKSGGKKMFEGIDSSKTLESVVSKTASWFSNRKVLFICDDLWKHSSSPMRVNDPASFSQTSYFNQLQGLLDGNPKSHMVISTRDSDIASDAEATVLFQSRSHCVARAIFMKSAEWDEKEICEIASEDIVNEVLGRCGGIPVTSRGTSSKAQYENS